MLNANEIERVSIDGAEDPFHVLLVALMRSQEISIISRHRIRRMNVPSLFDDATLSQTNAAEKLNEIYFNEAKEKAKEDYELCRDFLVSNDPFISFEKFNDFGPVPPPPNGK
jgi:hypothetical protein